MTADPAPERNEFTKSLNYLCILMPVGHARVLLPASTIWIMKIHLAQDLRSLCVSGLSRSSPRNRDFYQERQGETFGDPGVTEVTVSIDQMEASIGISRTRIKGCGQV